MKANEEVMVVERQETSDHNTWDGWVGGSVRCPNFVVDALDGLGIRLRALLRSPCTTVHYQIYYR